ncbi:uridine phosphorylase [Lactonifactor longoviformis]|uniref:Uridine phosphorylase n=1 Tax=Lactonifactor longoviformis DSM 17459 TaxID=1122155 RepID=A0A1M5BDA3_9CLOT|nr:nucleoside phosphorylase [Lactonifactor longoviformis]POP33358.1 uridine phosphorylase [Lactonifactor longoviformis]SHF40428.1 uridine phosphorylase [Lactonifactor longoviformis DSM 17459]
MSKMLKTEFPSISDAEYHIRLKKGDVPPYVLLPGAPERVDIVSSCWESKEELQFNREFRSARGNYQGTEMACVSTGIGTTSGEICIHELNQIGVHTAIRIGTTGSISPRFRPGDLIIPVAAIRADGTSDCYVQPAFPAVADLDVVNALGEACERLGFTYGYGIMYSPSSLYIGQGRKIKENGYWPFHAEHLLEDLIQARVTNIDTDSAGQFIVGYMHEMRMGSVLSVLTDRLHDTWAADNSGEYRACKAACEAVKILKERDEKESSYRR